MVEQATFEQEAPKRTALKDTRLGMFVKSVRGQLEERLGFDPQTGRIVGDDPLVIEARKKAKEVKDPGISFWDIFKSADPTTGERIPYWDRQVRNAELGAYHAQALGRWSKGLLDRFRNNPDDVFDRADRIGDNFWNGTGATGAAGKENDRASVDQKANVERMQGTGTDIMRARGPRVRFEPDRPENRVGSDYLGPERQVVRDPDGRRALSGPANKDAGAVVSAPRLLNGPRGEAKKGQQEALKKGPAELPGAAPVSRQIPGSCQPGSGRAAAQKGAAAARRIAQAAAARKRTSQKTSRKSRGGPALEI